MTILARAQSYHQAGLCVIPIRPDGSKRPATDKGCWKEYQTNLPELDQINDWFDNDQVGIAIVCGRVSGGLEVIDFEDPALFEQWRERVAAAAPGLVERLPIIQTPRPGRHVYYRCAQAEPGHKLARSEDKETLIETKGEGGYVLAPGCPPTCHPTSKTYEHLSGPPLTAIPTITTDQRSLLLNSARSFDAAARSSVLDHQGVGSAASHQQAEPSPSPVGADVLERARRYLDACQPAISDQGGHNQTFKVACNLIHRLGLSADEAYRVLLEHYNPRCRPLWSPRELEHKVHDAATNGHLTQPGPEEPGPSANGQTTGAGQAQAPASPVPEEPPLPLCTTPAAAHFPLQVLPQSLRTFAAHVAEVVGVAIDYVAITMLALAGAAIGASRALQVKPGHIYRPIAYYALIGPPGDAKTWAIQNIAKPLYDLQQQKLAQFEQANAEYEEKLAAYLATKNPTGPRPRSPSGPVRLYTADATREALAALLDANPRGVALLLDELSAWITGLNEYKGGRGSDKQFWLTNWTGQRGPIDRKGQATQLAQRPHSCATVVGGLQPDLLDLLRGRVNDGFLDRVLPCYPEAAPVAPFSWTALDPDIVKAWKTTLDKLYLLDLRQGEHGPETTLVQLSPTGREQWKIAYDRLAAEANREDFPRFLKGPWAKLRGYLGRLALVLHYLHAVAGEDATDAHVDGDIVQAAGLLLDYFASHIRKLWAALDADPAIADARRVLRCLINNSKLDNFSAAELHHQHLRKSMSLDQLEKALSLLVRHRFLRHHIPDRGDKRGPNPARYQVNRAWDRKNSTEVTEDTEVPPGEGKLG